MCLISPQFGQAPAGGQRGRAKICSGKNEGDVWQGQFKIGSTEAEQFQIVRAGYKNQGLCPAMSKCREGSILICGRSTTRCMI